jgi:hypothetical protein
MAAREQRLAKARLHMFAQLARVVGEPQQAELGHHARVQARVSDWQAVGDDRRAGGLGL